MLTGIFSRHRPRHDVRARPLPVHIHRKIGIRRLFAVRVDFFADDEIRARFQVGFGDAVGGIDALDLRRFHLQIRALFEMRHGRGIHDIFAVAVPFAVMLFDVFHAGVLPT